MQNSKQYYKKLSSDKKYFLIYIYVSKVLFSHFIFSFLFKRKMNQKQIDMTTFSYW